MGHSQHSLMDLLVFLVVHVDGVVLCCVVKRRKNFDIVVVNRMHSKEKG